MRVRLSLFIFLISFSAFSQSVESKFEHLSIADGLSHNSITSIIQDHKGLLWIGTSDGLNLYDGYSFRIFRANAFDSGSISSNKITKLYEDSDNVLWIGTRNGLNYFDWETFSFGRLSFDQYINKGSRVFIKAIYEDKNSDLWIGTYGQGLYRYDMESKILEHIPLEYGATP
jgi:ligand-binding sensor domain-containing protein